MHWLLLATAILLEVAGTTTLKLAGGFARPGYLGLSLVLYGTCLIALSHAFKVIPVGVAYAIWSGIGTALIVLVGVVWFAEVLTTLKAVFIAMILVGVVGLNLVSNTA